MPSVAWSSVWPIWLRSHRRFSLRIVHCLIGTAFIISRHVRGPSSAGTFRFYSFFLFFFLPLSLSDDADAVLFVPLVEGSCVVVVCYTQVAQCNLAPACWIVPGPFGFYLP